MAKSNIRVIHPTDAARSIQEYCSRVGALMNILPNVVEYLERTPAENEPLRNRLIELLKMHSENINEFRNEGM